MPTSSKRNSPRALVLGEYTEYPNPVMAFCALREEGYGHLPPMTLFGDMGQDANPEFGDCCDAMGTDQESPLYTKGMPNIVIHFHNDGRVSIRVND